MRVNPLLVVGRPLSDKAGRISKTVELLWRWRNI